MRLQLMNRPAPLTICTLAFGLAVIGTLGCKPPPSSSQPSAGGSNQAIIGGPADAKPAEGTEKEKEAETLTEDGLPVKVVENVEQVIKLTAEYNARAEKITDRQAYLDQSASLAELEAELSDYVAFMESVEPKLTAAQQATLNSKYFSRAKPLIDAKKQHKLRMLALPP